MTASPWPDVVQVAPFYPPHLGGVEVTVQVIATSLAATRRVEVLTTRCGASGQPALERSGLLTVRRLRAREIAHTPVAPGLVTRLIRLPRHCVVHVHIAQALTPEIVWITSRLRRRPYLAHFHLDVDPSGPAGRWLELYKRQLLARVLRGASRVIVLSAEQERFVIQQYQVSSKRVAVVPNGVPDAFAVVGERDFRRAAPLRLLFVGRLAPQKNLPDLIEAVHLMNQEAELVIVGDGDERSRLTRQVEALGLSNVRLPGRADRSELRGWYQWADVFVLSSHKEGMPLAVLEAMSAGLPVVATDVPGLRELCAGTGLLVPPDPGSLARALDSLAVDPRAREQLAGQSLAAASGAGWERSLARIEKLYLEAAR